MSRLCAVDPLGPEAARFRHLSVRVGAILDQKPLRSVLVTSPLAGEGKTTVAVNLALAFASVVPEGRIALVDLDLRRGQVGKILGYETARGFESVLVGDLQLDDVRVRTEMPSLDFYPIGKPTADAHRLLSGTSHRVLDQLHSHYDYVVFDGPPVLPVPDVPLIAPHVGGCLAVIASGRTPHSTFRSLLTHLHRSVILGAFLNESRAAAGSKNDSYYASVMASGDPEEEVEE